MDFQLSAGQNLLGVKQILKMWEMGEKVKRPNGNKTKFNETLQCSSPTGT